MSMYHGLDLSRFKKAGSDAKTTTLIHAKGHELKIAHSALSPEMKEKIGGLKCSQCDQVGCKCQKMAKGGKVSKQDRIEAAKTFETKKHNVSEDFRPNSVFDETDIRNPSAGTKQITVPNASPEMPQDQSDSSTDFDPAGNPPSDPSRQDYAEAQDNRQQATKFPTNSSSVYSGDNETVTVAPVQMPKTNPPVPQDTRQQADSSPEQAPDTAPEPVPAPAPAPDITPEERAAYLDQHLNDQSQMFAHELATGKINPMTIKDYYHNRSTLGKIGTIFGLLVSGAGSGLAHQQNAALDLINKELDRDLEGQKLSQGNAQNWFKLSMEHARNKALNAKTMAEIPYTEAQSKLALAQAGLQRALESKVPADIQRALAEVDAARIASAKVAADADHQNKINEILGADTSLTKEAKNRAMIGVSQYLQDLIDKMSPGPQKDKAQQYHDGLIAPGVGAEVTKNNNDIAKQALKPNVAPPVPQETAPLIVAPKSAPGRTVKPSGSATAPKGVAKTLPKTTKTPADEPVEQTPPDQTLAGGPVRNADKYGEKLEYEGAPKHIPVKPGDAMDENVFNRMVEENKKMKLAGIEGKMTDRDQERIKEESTNYKDIENIKDAYNKSFIKLNNAHRLTRKINPELYKSQTAALDAIMARSVAGKTILSEMQKQSEGAFPNELEWGGSAQQKYYKTMRMFSDRQNNMQYLKKFPELTKDVPRKDYTDPWNHHIYVNKRTGERAYKDENGKRVSIP